MSALAMDLVALAGNSGHPARPRRPHPHPASRWPGTLLPRPRPAQVRPQEADARRSGPPRGRNQRPDHGWLLRHEQEGRRGRLHGGLPQRHGTAGIFLTWNSGGFRARMAEGRPDDVTFVAKLLDDLATVVNVDPKRVYATGMSNGGMMCYRLAAELSDRIAAIAPVSGTMAIDDYKPKRPVPVMHFHGTADNIVPFNGPRTARRSS